MSNAMYRVLGTPELLHSINSYLNVAERVVVGLTCREVYNVLVKLYSKTRLTDKDVLITDVMVMYKSSNHYNALLANITDGKELPVISIIESITLISLLGKDPKWKPCCTSKTGGYKYGCKLIPAAEKEQCSCRCPICRVTQGVGRRCVEMKIIKNDMAKQAKEKAKCDDDTCLHQGKLKRFFTTHSWEQLLAIDLTACNIPTPNAVIIAAPVAAPVATPGASAPAQTSTATQG